MISVGQSEVRLADLSSLPPGQFFICRLGGLSRLAAKLAQEIPEETAWLNLSGKSAFQLESIRSDRRLRVLSLPYNAETVKLRLDLESSADGEEHEPGQLVVGESGYVEIAAIWPDLVDEDLRNTVTLGSWSQSTCHTPKFRYAKWALSVIDAAGVWRDLVIRSPTA